MGKRGGVCQFEDCTGKKYGHGMCHSHYYAWRRVADRKPLPIRTERLGSCLDCGEQTRAAAKGPVPKYCDDHAKGPRYKRRTKNCATCGAQLASAHMTFCGPCKAARKRKVTVFVKHGLGDDGAEKMLTAQGNACAICGKPMTLGTVVVDHDHLCCPTGSSCGKCVRGLLCSHCNVGIGMLGDDPAACRAAADYLENWFLLEYYAA